MNDLETISTNLKTIKPGYWVASANETISYPKNELTNSALFDEKSFWFEHRRNIVIDLFKKVNPGTLFDIGGGAGYMSLSFQNAGYDSVLLEPGQDGVGIALRRGVKKIIHATIQEAEIKNSTIPSIGLFDVIEHFEDDISFMAQINRILSDTGFLFITVPAYKFLWSDEDEYVGHYKRYSSSTMKKLLRESNFEIVYSTYLFSFLVIPIFLLRSIPSFFGHKMKHIKDRTKVEIDHVPKSSIITRVVDFICGIERKLIQLSLKVPFGSTYLVVAKKVRKN